MKLIRYEHPTLDELDKLFGLATPHFGKWGQVNRFSEEPYSKEKTAPTDLYEDEHKYFARMEVPGIKKEDINLNLENSVLTLHAESKQEEGCAHQSLSYSRSISIPDGVDAEKITATLDNGVLNVTLPKSENSKPRQISVR